MLHDFLLAHRGELIERCRFKAAQRAGPTKRTMEQQHGVPLFLDQLSKTLLLEHAKEPVRSRKVSGPKGGGPPAQSEIADTAALHGRELMQRGFTLEQVVHDYGDVCQAVTDLAFETNAEITVDEFRTLNRCLDNGIAVAVTEFSFQRDLQRTDRESRILSERLGSFAHELRNLVSSATLAVSAIKAGKVGLAGATGAVLDRSLVGMRILIDRSLVDVRLNEGMTVRQRLFSLVEFIAEIKMSSALGAEIKGCSMVVGEVDRNLAVDADRDLLLAAVGNLLDNAFKFTHLGTVVSLNAYAVGNRILIDVEDHCGGLPPSVVESMFLPFTQFAADQSGVGLGLSIARRSVEANLGCLKVRNVPGSGCMFTIDLPRHALPQQVSADGMAA